MSVETKKQSSKKTRCLKFCYKFYLCFLFFALASSISRFISNRFLVLWECDFIYLYLPTPVGLFVIYYILPCPSEALKLSTDLSGRNPDLSGSEGLARGRAMAEGGTQNPR